MVEFAYIGNILKKFAEEAEGRLKGITKRPKRTYRHRLNDNLKGTLRDRERDVAKSVRGSVEMFTRHLN